MFYLILTVATPLFVKGEEAEKFSGLRWPRGHGF